MLDAYADPKLTHISVTNAHIKCPRRTESTTYIKHCKAESSNCNNPQRGKKENDHNTDAMCT